MRFERFLSRFLPLSTSAIAIIVVIIIIFIIIYRLLFIIWVDIYA